jgi:hypothetical protein
MRCTPAFKARAKQRAADAGLNLSEFIEQCVEPAVPVLGQALAVPAGLPPGPADDPPVPLPPGRPVPPVPARASGNGATADGASEATSSGSLPGAGPSGERASQDDPGDGRAQVRSPGPTAPLPMHGSPSPTLARFLRQKGPK